MESERGVQAPPPDWVEIILDPASAEQPNLDVDQSGPDRTVRGEFIRRVRRAMLEDDEGAVLRAGLLALDGRLTDRAGSH